MCGIAGFVNFSENSGLGSNALLKSSRILKHRGPDDEGFLLISPDNQYTECYSDLFGKPENKIYSRNIEELKDQKWKVGLMHRRLAIIDPESEGHQPFSDPENQIWITFNGEIYNYKSLRTDLQQLGHRFYTETDTEVLVQSYLEWGRDCIFHLDGMWSFVLCDLRNQTIYASVDQTGIKPLYYYLDHEKFCFASEIKAFSAFEIPFQDHENVSARFLTHGLSDESEETFFKHIFRLRGSHSISINLRNSQVEKTEYQQISISNRFDFQPNIKEWDRVESIQSLLIEMIRLRLQSDVPLGVCLSGGIDSSTIAGLVAFADRNSKQQTVRKAFMATMPTGSPFDESRFARQVANEKGFEFHTTQPEAKQFTDSIEDLIFTLDEPPPGPNAYSQYAVFQKVAEQGITVTLDGQGADEIFAGYPRHQEYLLFEGLMHGSVPWDSAPHLKDTCLNGFRSIISDKMAFQILRWKKPEFEMLRQETFELGGKKGNFYTSVNKGLINEFTSSSLPFLMKAADRNSMRWSIESRMPFADFQPLVQYLFQIPGSAKIQAAYSKFLLRKAAQPFVPQAILERKDKVGFAAPNSEWIKSIPQTDWDELFAVPNPFVDETQVRKWLKFKNKMDIILLWRIFAYLKWRKIFL